MGKMNYNVKKALQEQKKIKMPGNLYYWTQTKFAYNSNHMEGSRLTEEQTRMLYETKTFISNGEETIHYDDVIETGNHFRLFDNMIDHCDEPLTISMMHEFHKILKTGTTDSSLDWFVVGGWKKLPNTIGDNVETSAPDKVEEDITSLLMEYHALSEVTLEDIVRFHYRFEGIHPYQDGNGRVGRMIIFKECLRHGIVPFIIEDMHKSFYYRGLKNFKTDVAYLMDTCLNAQDRYKAYYDKMIGDLYSKE